MMKSVSGAFAALALLGSAPGAAAEVVARTADGFTLQFSAPVQATPGDVASAIEGVGRWWESAHTYSGDAANMTLELKVGGCFCEALANGEVFEHGRVTAFDDDHLVLDAPLGPLNGHTSRADLTFRWPERGEGATVIMTFEVEGPQLGAAADPVDGVMTVQFQRLIRLVEGGAP